MRLDLKEGINSRVDESHMTGEREEDNESEKDTTKVHRRASRKEHSGGWRRCTSSAWHESEARRTKMGGCHEREEPPPGVTAVTTCIQIDSILVGPPPLLNFRISRSSNIIRSKVVSTQWNSKRSLLLEDDNPSNIFILPVTSVVTSGQVVLDTRSRCTRLAGGIAEEPRRLGKDRSSTPVSE